MKQFAGLYGTDIAFTSSAEFAKGVAITVTDEDGVTLSSLYTDHLRTGPVANPITTDAVTGEYAFYAEPGIHVLLGSGGFQATVLVPNWKDEPPNAGQVTEAMLAFPVATQTEIDAETAARIAADALLVPLAQRGAANGVATLDGSSLIPDAQIPPAITRDSELAGAIAALVNASPATLDTLKELADALGDDPNFATTMTTALAARVLKAGDTSTGEQIAPSFKASGKTGATATPMILGGGTASGAPTTGAHLKGELVMDDAGDQWRCTVAGTPGTWIKAGSATFVPLVSVATPNDKTTIFRVTHSVAARGASGFTVGENTFAGAIDPAVQFGYNQDGTGGNRKANENSGFWAVEGYYDDGSGAIKMEAYQQFVRADATGFVRPFFAQYDRTNEKISAVQIAGDGTSTATGSALVGFVGMSSANPSAAYNVFDVSVNRLVLYAPNAADDTSISLRAAATKGAFVQLGYDAVAAKTQFYTAATTQARVKIQTHDIVYFYDAFSLGAAVAIGVDDTGAGLTVVPYQAASPSIVARAKAAQSVNVFEVQESGGAVHIFVTKATSTVKASLVIGNSALATTATDGFVYIPSCAGPPTGVPTAKTGTMPVVYDSTNNFLYIYNGGWKKSTVYA